MNTDGPKLNKEAGTIQALETRKILEKRYQIPVTVTESKKKLNRKRI